MKWKYKIGNTYSVQNELTHTNTETTNKKQYLRNKAYKRGMKELQWKSSGIRGKKINIWRKESNDRATFLKYLLYEHGRNIGDKYSYGMVDLRN